MKCLGISSVKAHPSPSDNANRDDDEESEGTWSEERKDSEGNICDDEDI